MDKKGKRGKKLQPIAERVRIFNATHGFTVQELRKNYVVKGMRLLDLSNKYGMSQQALYNTMVRLGGLTSEDNLTHLKNKNAKKFKKST